MIGLFLKEVICIDFAHFCKGVYTAVEGIANQDSFVSEIFKASGSSYAFTKKGAYSASNYGAKLFNGGKPLSRKHLDSFPNPINTAGLAKYLSAHIKKESARIVMNYFTIPTDADINVSTLARALADQFQIIINEPDSDADVVATNYQFYLTNSAECNASPYMPLYDGDSFWVETPSSKRQYTVMFYEHFTHTWKLLNTGKVIWQGRKLLCKNRDDISPCPLQKVVNLPETAPNEQAIVSIEFDARGEEDSYTSRWYMVDSNDKDCFPNHSSSLDIMITVENKAFTKSGGN